MCSFGVTCKNNFLNLSWSRKAIFFRCRAVRWIINTEARNGRDVVEGIRNLGINLHREIRRIICRMSSEVFLEVLGQQLSLFCIG